MPARVVCTIAGFPTEKTINLHGHRHLKINLIAVITATVITSVQAVRLKGKSRKSIQTRQTKRPERYVWHKFATMIRLETNNYLESKYFVSHQP